LPDPRSAAIGSSGIGIKRAVSPSTIHSHVEFALSRSLRRTADGMEICPRAVTLVRMFSLYADGGRLASRRSDWHVALPIDRTLSATSDRNSDAPPEPQVASAAGAAIDGIIPHARGWRPTCGSSCSPLPVVLTRPKAGHACSDTESSGRAEDEPCSSSEGRKVEGPTAAPVMSISSLGFSRRR
jgi:hypothetical protein